MTRRNERKTPDESPISYGFLGRFLAGWRFPVVMMSVLLAFSTVLLAVLVVPVANGGHVGGIVNDLRVWCFGYDPATGEYEWAYVAMMIVNPLMLVGLVALVWWRPLSRALQQRRHAVLGYVAGSLLFVAGATAGLGAFTPSDASTELPFPAEQLRTSHAPPEIELVAHDGTSFSLDETRGKVVMLTAIYASCPHTCPIILEQAQRAIAGLDPEDRDDVVVVAVTMDPANDTPARLRSLAELHGIDNANYRLLTGPPSTVEQVLDRLGVERRVDEETGVIDHTNVFAVVDRAGRIAYRFSLGERQERWLGSALRLLLAEEVPKA